MSPRVARPVLVAMAVLLGACSATTTIDGTLAELHSVAPDLEEIALENGLEQAAQSYRQYLEETEESELTPEAMRRLADLQVEQAYGILGSGDTGGVAYLEMEASASARAETRPKDMRAPESAAKSADYVVASAAQSRETPAETEAAFEARALAADNLQGDPVETDGNLAREIGESAPQGPREAIETYWKILEKYPNYERNDQVLYQMSRAYDEIGQPDDAMMVMDRLVTEFPYSNYVDEVQFRRGEYFFVRKRYREAEAAYGAIISMGPTSSFYELARYKLGWSLYKQDFYEDALHNFLAMLDHRASIGYDFERPAQQQDEHRVADTFRVISLSFSNLGGPEVIDGYFTEFGQRGYADKIYSNLGEFYFEKLRYDDAATVYHSFVDLNPNHRIAPYFGMRIIEIYDHAGFPILVVESKKEFATRYALSADYWKHFDPQQEAEVVGYLKANLTDLANHYHSLYQTENRADDRAMNFDEAQRWYRRFLGSFPAVAESPGIHYQLADLLLENGDFELAAREYEATAYHYEGHEQSADAGYAAVFAYRSALEAATGANKLDVKRLTVESSLRFADEFVGHAEAPAVLGAAANDLYDMQEFDTAITSAQKLIERYPESDSDLLRSAWAVFAHSSMDVAAYDQAETGYSRVLELMPTDDESRSSAIDSLAAAIYKQGEQAILLDDFRTAATQFLRIRDAAPTSALRVSAEYDGAVALMKLQDWGDASSVLERFRHENPDHDLSTEATKQLAHAYREHGKVERSAAEHERIAAESADPELAREAILTAAEMYDQVHARADAVRVYGQYVESYPQPLDVNVETRSRLAEIYKYDLEYDLYHDQLRAIVAADRAAAGGRTDRSRYLAGRASLELATIQFENFRRLQLVQPFEQSLAEKQARMDETLAALQALVDYEVADVTAAATFLIAETYLGFSDALLASERPAELSDSERIEYELVIEEEAYPFEETAIEIHERNTELLAAGIFNDWIQKSLDQLAIMVPGRYAKAEISGGFVGAIDTYAYRMPIAPPPTAEPEDADAFSSQVIEPESTSAAAALTKLPTD